MIRSSVTHSAQCAYVPLFCSYHILMASLTYNWTDTQQQGIYLSNRETLTVFSSVVKHAASARSGLLAQLVKRCTGIVKVMGSNPVRTWIFYHVSSVHNYEDRFRIQIVLPFNFELVFFHKENLENCSCAICISWDMIVVYCFPKATALIIVVSFKFKDGRFQRKPIEEEKVTN